MPCDLGLIVRGRYLAYQRTQAVDVPQLFSSDRSPLETRECLRAALVRAMKAGDTLLLRLRDSTPDWGALADDGDFPEVALRAGGAEVAAAPWLERVYREGEKESGVCVVREGFQVVVSAQRGAEEYTVALGSEAPLKHFEAILVETDE